MAGRFQGNLPERTFDFALRVLSLADELPNNVKGWVIAKQMVSAGTSIGANVREASVALTDAEFAHKCSIARKEACETNYWLELCAAGNLVKSSIVKPATVESDELLRILSTIVKKTQTHLKS